MTTPAEHWATICDDFLSRDKWAECSCGWVGEKCASNVTALGSWAAHFRDTAGDGTTSIGTVEFQE